MTVDPLKSARGWRPATALVHGGGLRTPFGETSEALFLTAGYVYNTAEDAEARFKGEQEGYVYSRFSNPTVAMFEGRMALLEGADGARATATGMAAVTASMLCQLSAGDHVVSSSVLFGSCRYIVETLLPRFGISHTFVDGRDLDQWRAAVRPNTRVFFCETPANPTLELIDIAGVAEIARGVGARFIVDNVFATPILQKPLALGADIAVYSATKHIDGQGRCLGGVVLANAQFIEDNLKDFLRQTGPSLSPFNAWVLLKGLETLPLRVERQSANAAAIADFLSERRGVACVLYPGREDHPQHALAKRQMLSGGPMLAFRLEGGKAAAFRLMNALKIIKISNNLGDAKSLISHPATTTHQRLTPDARAEIGITDDLLRLSAGLEDVNDLIEDLDQAVAASV
ncbi:MAG: O-succinylhomoserine sulfhydrylase [Hyphomicrobiales bacterium]|nr:O-succinylhomoserine sulfhydrylase [Hyphomicrobiales bacterium]